MRRGNIQKEEKKIKSKIKVNIIGLVVILITIILLCIYVPRAIEIAKRHSSAGKVTQAVIKYPREISLTAENKVVMNDLAVEFALGIISEVDPSDGFTNKEMINFARHNLSEKYSSSGIIPKTSLDTSIKRYFDVENLSYTKEGYKKLTTYVNKKEKLPVYYITKLEQLEKDGDKYKATYDIVGLDKIQDGKYDKKDVKEEYVLQLQKKDETEVDQATGETKVIGSRYIFISGTKLEKTPEIKE